MNLNTYAKDIWEGIIRVADKDFDELVNRLWEVFQNGDMIFTMGNGGSGATASHFVCDLNKGVFLGSYNLAREGWSRRFKALCLNDNVPTLTAYANDACYENIFVEPLKNFLTPGYDRNVVIGISGSGNSKNVLKAIDWANLMGAYTVGLCGFGGGELAKKAKLVLCAPLGVMQQVEDAHSIILHAASLALRKRLDE
jgi:D-sedoheptulose 7-phosphate isomerase